MLDEIPIFKRHNSIHYFCFLIFILLVFLPVTQAGYFFEDARTSLLPGHLLLNHLNFFQYILHEIYTYWENARFFPIQQVVSSLFLYLFSLNQFEQEIRIVFILLSLLSGLILLKKILKSMVPGLLLFLWFPFVCQATDFHSPLTGMDILMPFFTIILFLCLYFYLHHDNGRMRFIGPLFLVVALLTYEIGIIIPIALLILQGFSSLGTLKYRPYLVVTISYLLGEILLRKANGYIYPTVELGSLHEFPLAFLKQFSATIPFSTYFFQSETLDLVHAFCVKKDLFTVKFLLIGFGIFVISFILNQIYLYSLEIDRKNSFFLARLGAVFIILPSVMVAFSAVYQQKLTFGLGFHTVYIQYIGLVFLFIGVTGFWLKELDRNNQYRLKKYLIGTLSFLVSFGIGTNFFLNTAVIQSENEIYKYPRTLLISALNHHIINRSQLSTIISNSKDWNSPEFYMQYDGLKVGQVLDMTHIEEAPEIIDSIKEKKDKSEKLLVDSFHLPYTDYGYVIVGGIEKLLIDRGKGKEVFLIEDPKVFINCKKEQDFKIIVENLKNHLKSFDSYQINKLLNYKTLQRVKIFTLPIKHLSYMYQINFYAK